MFRPSRARRVTPPSPALHENGHVEIGKGKNNLAIYKKALLLVKVWALPLTSFLLLQIGGEPLFFFFSPHKFNTDGDLE